MQCKIHVGWKVRCCTRATMNEHEYNNLNIQSLSTCWQGGSMKPIWNIGLIPYELVSNQLKNRYKRCFKSLGTYKFCTDSSCQDRTRNPMPMSMFLTRLNNWKLPFPHQFTMTWLIWRERMFTDCTTPLISSETLVSQFINFEWRFLYVEKPLSWPWGSDNKQ